MRAVVQLCSEARVIIDREIHAEIGRGMVLLVGIGVDDTEREASLLADRIAKLRIFPDENGRLNKNLCDPLIQGDLLVVSNFTLYANCKKSRRPDFFASAKGDGARMIFDTFLAHLRLKLDAFCAENGYLSPEIRTGIFGADMQVSLTNDGPVTLMLDTAAL